MTEIEDLGSGYEFYDKARELLNRGKEIRSGLFNFQKPVSEITLIVQNRRTDPSAIIVRAKAFGFELEAQLTGQVLLSNGVHYSIPHREGLANENIVSLYDKLLDMALQT